MSIELVTRNGVTVSVASDAEASKFSFSATGKALSDKTLNAVVKAMAEAIEASEMTEEMLRLLDATVSSLHPSVRTGNVLEVAGVRYVGQLVAKREVDVLRMKNAGEVVTREVIMILSRLGLSLGSKFSDWVPPDQR